MTILWEVNLKTALPTINFKISPYSSLFNRFNSFDFFLFVPCKYIRRNFFRFGGGIGACRLSCTYSRRQPTYASSKLTIPSSLVSVSSNNLSTKRSMEDLYILSLDMEHVDNDDDPLLTSALHTLLSPSTEHEQQIKQKINRDMNRSMKGKVLRQIWR